MSDYLPRHLSEAEVRQIAADCETVLDFQMSARIKRREACLLIKDLDLTEELTRANGWGRGSAGDKIVNPRGSQDNQERAD